MEPPVLIAPVRRSRRCGVVATVFSRRPPNGFVGQRSTCWRHNARVCVQMLSSVCLPGCFEQVSAMLRQSVAFRQGLWSKRFRSAAEKVCPAPLAVAAQA
eukprot:7916915-Lingulodinium_polyedra.AAC.1